jgi:thiol-disulfide isomerase/thioredoxin
MNVRRAGGTMRKRSEAVFTQRRKVKSKRRKEDTDLFAPLRPSLRRCVTFLLCCLLLAGCNSNDPPNTNTPVISRPPPGTTYPMPPTGRAASLASMGWQSTDGKRSVFSEYQGKVLVLDFYATWCGPCRESVPHLIGLQNKYKDQGLVVVGLNVGDPEDKKKVPEFAKEFGIQYILAEPDEDLAAFLLADSDAIPQTFVFDRQGQLVQRFTGFGPETGVYLDAAVETGLKIPAQ